MGISGEFSVFDMINSATRSKTGVSTKDFTEIWLSPYEVKEAEQNTHHECKNIEALADDFLLVGQHSPTILGRVNGEYWIVDGHRRNMANIHLLENGYLQYSKVRYLYKDMTEDMYELSLLSGNGFTQELTPYEKAELAGRLKKVLEKLRDTGEIEVKGRIRDIIGKYLGETSGQMGRFEKINNSLIDEAKEQFKAGKIGTTAAYETSRLQPEEQKIIAKKAAENGGIEAKEIAEIVKEKKESEKQAKRETTTQEELSEENADQSAGVLIGMNPPIVSESDTENDIPSPEAIEQEAIIILQQLLTIPEKLTYEDVVSLQGIFIERNRG